MSRYLVAVLPGDGIGPEVTAEALRALAAVGDLFGYRFDVAEHAITLRPICTNTEWAVPAT